MKIKDVIFAGLAFYGAKKLVEKVVDKYSDQIEAFARRKGAEIGEKIAGEIFSKKSEEKKSECPSYKDYALATALRDISQENDVFVYKVYPRAALYTNALQGVISEYGPQEIIDIWRVAKWQK